MHAQHHRQFLCCVVELSIDLTASHRAHTSISSVVSVYPHPTEAKIATVHPLYDELVRRFPILFTKEGDAEKKNKKRKETDLSSCT